MTDGLHPALFYLVGALLIPLLRGRARQVCQIVVPLLAIACVLALDPGSYGLVTFAGRELVMVQVDRLSLVFGVVFTLMSLIGMVYALHVHRPGEHIAAFLYVGSALIVVFAGDFFTLFVGWEVMAFASAYLIFAQGGRAALGAGYRYLLVHVTGGVCLLAGIVLYTIASGTALFGPLPADGSLAYYLILCGFLLNAAVPPLNAWLTDAYPEATVTGAVFLCAFTTKTAVYVLIRAYPAAEILVVLGVIMALYGVVYAVLENDCRRLLGYHIVSQVGYMVAGVGIGTELALNGATAHAFAHILYKALLFMGAGAVIYMTGRRKLTELGGLYRTMPLTLTLYMIGAFAISAFPFFSGFVSKSMVIAAAAGDNRALATLLLTMASSGTFLHTGLKLPYYMFFGKDCGLRPAEPPRNMLLGMGLAAFFCIAIGVYPDMLYRMLPFPVDFVPYTGAHVTGSLGILLFTGLGFFLFLRHLDPKDTVSLDTDWFYRKGARAFLWFAERPVARYEGVVSELANTVALRSLRLGARAGLWFDINVVDAVVNGVANMTLRGGALLRRLQTGVLSHYATAMVAGLFVSLLLYALFTEGGR
ncbi:MAG: Na(+)/H(+) antiporter subunit D [Gammaproteobacteria bacterium]|nr:MAG: Na(+)/H(+) antiporter subunit D [Gammaproteobacteria bacterium]